MEMQYHEIYHDHPVYQRMIAPGPKRMLALDGGGIRGALTIGYLEKIEKLLRDRFDDKAYTLSQYYDLIGGTSTGAIIASLLAIGWEVEKIKSLYLTLGEKIFSKKKAAWIPGKLRYLFLTANYDEQYLEEGLKEHLDIVLGSGELQTGLCIVTRRADDYGTYTFSNHPGSPYYELNKGILLSEIVRASSAAPTYFTPKTIQFDNNEKGVFVDGGVSSANNPALNLFMMATIEHYGYNWHMGKNELLITSVGTGSYRPKMQMDSMKKLLNRKSIAWAPELPNLFMADAATLNHQLLEFMANPQLSKHVTKSHPSDSESFVGRGAFTYHRFDIKLNKTTLQELSKYENDEKSKSLREMDEGKNASDLYHIGSSAAEKQINETHFPKIFNLTAEYLESHVYEYSAFREYVIPRLTSAGKRYRKSRFIIASEAQGGERVVTLVDNQKETINAAEPGDFIVTNQTSNKEKYIIKPKAFHERYEFVRTLSDGSREYGPRGIVLGMQLTKKNLEAMNMPPHFLFIAPWGKLQYARMGDYIVSKEDYTDAYRVSLNMFRETYVEV